VANDDVMAHDEAMHGHTPMGHKSWPAAPAGHPLPVLLLLLPLALLRWWVWVCTPSQLPAYATSASSRRAAASAVAAPARRACALPSTTSPSELVVTTSCTMLGPNGKPMLLWNAPAIVPVGAPSSTNVTSMMVVLSDTKPLTVPLVIIVVLSTV